MARVMYVECFSGAAGDMLLGALLDAGLPLAILEEALGSLRVGHQLRVTRVSRAGLQATKFDVLDASTGRSAEGAGVLTSHGDEGHDHVHEHANHHSHDAGEHAHAHGHPHGSGGHGHRSLDEITRLIQGSALSTRAKERAVSLFRRLAAAEAAIHGTPIDEVHLHEVGALDSIIDIVGCVFAMEWFGIEDVVASPLNVGGGTVQIAHGRFPVPAPATVSLLTGVPIYSAGPQVELVTPTGALIVSAYARSYGPAPSMIVERAGYGAGTRDFAQMPNVLRVLLGERADRPAPAVPAETVFKIECEIDDMNPQLFGPASDRLFAAGALDVFLTPVQMKKGRPGTLVTVLSAEEHRQTLCDVLFTETTTLGVRFERVWRETLDRRWVDVPTSGGVVRFKIASRAGRVINAVPEFDDCLRIADRTGRPVKAVQDEALRAWHARPAIE